MSEVRHGQLFQPDFIEPTKPDCDLMDMIHRGNDGYISITRKNSRGEWENICAIPASRLPGLFAEDLASLVDQDGYFSINSQYHYKTRNPYGICDENGDLLYLPARQGTRHLRHLTACYVDLDIHRLNITTGQAIGAVIDAQERGDIPNASVITRSGRGIWLLWLLQDPNGGLQRGFPEKERAWSRIQAAIGARFQSLAADQNARDCSRVTRIPGSLNRKAGQRVSYWVQYDEEGQIPTYTLQSLADAFQVDISETSRPRTGIIVNERRSAIAAKGQHARWMWDYQAFWELMGLRGVIPIGCRSHHLMVIGLIIGRLFREPEPQEAAIANAVTQLHPMIQQGRNGDRFTLADVERLIRYNATKKAANKSLRHDSISGYLRVTEEESDQLRSILKRDSWPPSPEFGRARAQTRTRAEEAAQRQEVLRLFASQVSVKFPTLRELQDLLKDRGLSASIATIKKDLEAIGIKTGREQSAKPSPSQLPSLLDDSPG